MIERSARSPVDAVQPQVVRQALAAIRHLESKARHEPNPLLGLAVVEARLRELGVAPSEENRQWALAGVLEEVVSARLEARRPRQATRAGALSPRAEISLARELERVAEDFQAGDRVRECWSALHSRFISTAGPPMDEVARVAGVGRVTLARRLNEGLALLADALRERELDLTRRPDSALLLPPAERIRVGAEGRTHRGGRADSVASRILEAVRAERHAGLDLSLADTRAFAGRPPADLAAYRAARIAEWSQPRYALDQRFVRLTLVVDDGEARASGRWRAGGTFDSLPDALAAAASPVVALLGPPGCGKSSLLGRFELDEAVAALRGEGEGVTFFVPLNQYRAGPGGPAPAPGTWLAARWRARHPRLPELADLLAGGQLTLLLDGLNEIPHRDAAEYHQLVAAWRRFLVRRVAPVAGNRAIVSCRGLDYSATLSTPELRVPQVQVEPLSDAQVRAFLGAHRPALAEAVWARLEGTPQLEVVRVPYALRLLVDQVGPDGNLPVGAAALFTGMVRHALRREVERDHPAFRPGPAFDDRDLRQVAQQRWRTPYDLPERGRLFGGLADLAWGMQRDGLGGERAQVRARREVALALAAGAAERVGHDGLGAAAVASQVLAAGAALGVLDEDVASDETSFRHHLLQEYFAARRLARAPDPSLVRQAWRAEEVSPPLEEVLARRQAGEPLPVLPSTGWEESAGLAAAMAADPEAFLAGVSTSNLALGGAIAAGPGVRPRLGEAFLADLRRALAGRSRDPGADLRARIGAGRALGELGDPRFEERAGPDGACLRPPCVALPAGRYPLGRAEPFEALGRQWWARYAPHEVALGSFALGRFPVTNAEWARFLAAGGYDEGRWWDTPAAAAWRRGEGTTLGIHASVREWVARYRADPDLLEATWREGAFDDEIYARWRGRIAMTATELERHMEALYPSVRRTAPRLWSDRRFNHPAQPVVGVTWYEARAYCAWLAAQTGEAYRLPTDAELEAAARGREGRGYPWDGPYDPLRANSVGTGVMATTPVGVFPGGDSPEGITDLAGNVEAWTSTLAGEDAGRSGPSRRRWRPALEVADAPPLAARVVRGGSWMDNHSRVHPAYGVAFGPDYCPETVGVRLALGG